MMFLEKFSDELLHGEELELDLAEAPSRHLSFPYKFTGVGHFLLAIDCRLADLDHVLLPFNTVHHQPTVALLLLRAAFHDYDTAVSEENHHAGHEKLFRVRLHLELFRLNVVQIADPKKRSNITFLKSDALAENITDKHTRTRPSRYPPSAS